ncbi:MAG TPA: hypothetical protein VFM88_01770 [Vicinamibacteria bacterium]|nr:hypothetical protein [Vicinamibacteria bacterium]
MIEEPEKEPNPLVEAFKNQYNLIGLFTALGFSILSASPLPLILAAGVELMCLPLLERWERLKRAQALEAEKKQRKATEVTDMLRALTPSERQRYHALETLGQEIRQNYRALDPSSRILLEELAGKLDFLLAFYLRMRYSLVRYESYFATTDPARIEERIEALDREIAKGPERVQAIKARTKRVLQKRLERYKKALENRNIVDAQTETVQEVLQLLRDQSFSMRDPRTIAEQLDGLVTSAEETERGVRDMEDILAAEQEVLLPASMGEAEEELPELPSERTAEAGRSRGRVVPMPPAGPPRKKITQ